MIFTEVFREILGHDSREKVKIDLVATEHTFMDDFLNRIRLKKGSV